MCILKNICIGCYPELMSGKAAKECATTTYARVPSKSKLLASKLPNIETCSSIERHNDDLKTHVFCGSDVRNLTLTQWSAFDLATVKWPSERVTLKTICRKNVVDLKIPGPLTDWGRLLFRSRCHMTKSGWQATWRALCTSKTEIRK